MVEQRAKRVISRDHAPQRTRHTASSRVSAMSRHVPVWRSVESALHQRCVLDSSNPVHRARGRAASRLATPSTTVSRRSHGRWSRLVARWRSLLDHLWVARRFSGRCSHGRWSRLVARWRSLLDHLWVARRFSGRCSHGRWSRLVARWRSLLDHLWVARRFSGRCAVTVDGLYWSLAGARCSTIYGLLVVSAVGAVTVHGLDWSLAGARCSTTNAVQARELRSLSRPGSDRGLCLRRWGAAAAGAAR